MTDSGWRAKKMLASLSSDNKATALYSQLSFYRLLPSLEVYWLIKCWWGVRADITATPSAPGPVCSGWQNNVLELLAIWVPSLSGGCQLETWLGRGCSPSKVPVGAISWLGIALCCLNRVLSKTRGQSEVAITKIQADARIQELLWHFTSGHFTPWALWIPWSWVRLDVW